MKTKTIVPETLSLSLDTLSTCRLKQLVPFRWSGYLAYTTDSESGLRFATAAKAAFLNLNALLPDFNKSGFFMGLAWSSTPLVQEKPGRPPVDNETENYHDSESGDIYDLFNACNGVMVDGLVDVEQLNNYTAEEAEVLNIIRLREIWEHTRRGCLHCRNIVEALHALRRVAGDLADEIRSHDDTDPDINHIRSIA